MMMHAITNTYGPVNTLQEKENDLECNYILFWFKESFKLKL